MLLLGSGIDWRPMRLFHILAIQSTSLFLSHQFSPFTKFLSFSFSFSFSLSFSLSFPLSTLPHSSGICDECWQICCGFRNMCTSNGPGVNGAWFEKRWSEEENNSIRRQYKHPRQSHNARIAKGRQIHCLQNTQMKNLLIHYEFIPSFSLLFLSIFLSLLSFHPYIFFIPLLWISVFCFLFSLCMI